MAQEPGSPTAVIDLNTTDEDTLAGFQNVGRDRARILIQHRPYKDWDAVRKVPGIGPEIVDVLALGGVQIGHPTPAD